MTRYLLFLLFPLLYCTCDPAQNGNGPVGPETFDRQAMLAHWADAIFHPATQDFAAAAASQHIAATRFVADPTEEKLGVLRQVFEETYLSWQSVAPFMTGAGETNRIRERTNTYPVDTVRLLAEPEANLELPSNIDVQGFPALDYLLYGTDDPSLHREQIARLTSEIATNTGLLTESWQGTSRDDYVSKSGNSATASVDRTVNDFIFWYEKYLRAGKVGIPAGVFSSQAKPGLAEAPYHGALSRRLFLGGLATAEAFFTTDPGLKDYLDALGVQRDGQALSDRIEANFAAIRTAASGLDDDFATQVRNDNTAMLQLYDALQANTILLKVDMLQALGINVDYVDADGD